MTENIENNDPKETIESKEPKESNETKEINETQEQKENEDEKEITDNKEIGEEKENTDEKEIGEEKENTDEKENTEEKENSEEKEIPDPFQNLEITDKLTGEKNLIDLNKIFKIDLSYNFELLKNLLTIIVKNQQENENKINELSSRISGGRSHFDSSQKSKPYISKLKQKTKIDTKCLQKTITPPPNDIEIDPSESNDPTVIKIIVS